MTTSLQPSREKRAESRRASTRGFRTDIQALRALAIAAVVLNHLWPTRFTGGYVGVDVFFVISGFLITGHLFGEIARSGRIGLGRFYARRIRRLLPAALLVLAVSAVLVAVFIPYGRWERNALEIAASATYVENWALAVMSVNYSALNDAASAVQHFWSLSVEEQFYLVWPLVLLGTVLLVSRLRPAVPRRTIAAFALGAVAVSSVAASVLYTATHPAQAYFTTYTRAWEFAVGGLVALLFVGRRGAPTAGAGSRRGAASVLAIIGLALIVAPIFLFGHDTPFPGSAAILPVLGTASVIAAGSLVERTWIAPALGLRPVQWVGDVSYSLYLWHWPLIVVAPFALSQELSGGLRVGILGAAVVLAWASRRWVERPAQTATWWSSSVRRSVWGMLIGWLIVMLAAGLLFVGSAVRTSLDTPSASPPEGSCAGPNALVATNGCADPFGPAASVQMGPRNEYFYTPPECGDFLPVMTYGDTRTTHLCDFSRGAPEPKNVWLVGDSHAQQWQGPVFDLARERGWKLTISYVGGCPVADVTFLGFRSVATPDSIEPCKQWNRDVVAAISQAAPDLVITSMAARHELVDDGSGRDSMAQYVEGLRHDWSQWTAVGSHVLVIADPPLNGDVRGADCVALNAADPRSCARPKAEAQPEDPLAVAATGMGDPAVALFDPTPYFCDADTCYAVVGGVPAYYDADHLNLEYARLLGPMIAAKLPAG